MMNTVAHASPKPRFFRSQKEFRAWLERNHTKATGVWVGYHKKASPKLTKMGLRPQGAAARGGGAQGL